MNRKDEGSEFSAATYFSQLYQGDENLASKLLLSVFLVVGCVHLTLAASFGKVSVSNSGQVQNVMIYLAGCAFQFRSKWKPQRSGPEYRPAELYLPR